MVNIVAWLEFELAYKGITVGILNTTQMGNYYIDKKTFQQYGDADNFYYLIERTEFCSNVGSLFRPRRLPSV